jgi:HEPN domain-containing protein
MEIKAISIKPYEKENKDVNSSKLVKIAQRDFEAAKALFERKLYANAVYILQQSIERATRAILIKLTTLVHFLKLHDLSSS